MKDARKGELFRDAVTSLQQAGHKLCVLHGYEGYPEEIASDVDAICEDPAQVPRILYERGVASIVQAWHPEPGGTYRLYRLHRQCNGKPVLLVLDLLTDYGREGYRFLKGEELLKTCRRFKFFDVPAPELEFACYLIRRLMKGSLDEAQARRLSRLYSEEPAGCTSQLARFFPEPEAKLIADAAQRDEWEFVRQHIRRLRQAVLDKVRREHPIGALQYWMQYRLSRMRMRFEEVLRPPGLWITFLGPDGSGKTTVGTRVEQDLASAFSSIKWYQRRPLGYSSWRWVMRRYREMYSSPPDRGLSSAADGKVHRDEPIRGLSISLGKLAFWWAFTVFGHMVDIRPRLVDHTLVIFDRYLWDLLVYPEHYRYGGPLWLARFVSRFIPQPNIVILLDAPPEVIQARKQEVPFEETARQRQAYLKVISGLSNGHVVNASKPLDDVVDEVERIVLGYMADRTARRLRLQKK
jgi:thymidylate kinase